MSVLYDAMQSWVNEDVAHTRSLAIRVETEDQFDDFWNAVVRLSPSKRNFAQPYIGMYKECANRYGKDLALRVAFYKSALTDSGWCDVTWYKVHTRSQIFDYYEFLDLYGTGITLEQSDMALSDLFS